MTFWRTVLAKELQHTVSFVGIDEADCVRENLGKRFKPAYLELTFLCTSYPLYLLWPFLQRCLLPLNSLLHVTLVSESHIFMFRRLSIVQISFSLSKENSVCLLNCPQSYKVLILLNILNMSPRPLSYLCVKILVMISMFSSGKVWSKLICNLSCFHE